MGCWIGWSVIVVKRRGGKGVCAPTIMTNISSCIATLSIEVAVQAMTAKLSELDEFHR